MSPRLDAPISRQVWLALIAASALFLVSLVLMFMRMTSTDTVLEPSSAPAGPVASGSR
jgi:hypothetical protein